MLAPPLAGRYALKKAGRSQRQHENREFLCASGGVREAISDPAERTLRRLSLEESAGGAPAFPCLITPGRAQATTRAPWRDALKPIHRKILEQFARPADSTKIGTDRPRLASPQLNSPSRGAIRKNPIFGGAAFLRGWIDVNREKLPRRGRQCCKPRPSGSNKAGARTASTCRIFNGASPRPLLSDPGDSGY